MQKKKKKTEQCDFYWNFYSQIGFTAGVRCAVVLSEKIVDNLVN